MNKKIIIIVGALLVVIAGVAVVASRSAKPATDTSMNMPAGSNTAGANMPKDANSVVIKGYAFNPKVLTVKVGTTVTWTNNDIAKHNIAVDDGAPAGGPKGPLFGQGETFKFTFNTAGTYKYHCEPHPYMHGEVDVTP